MTKANEPRGLGQFVKSALKGLKKQQTQRQAEREARSGAADSDTASAGVLERRAAGLVEQGQFAEAEAVCREGLRRFPEHTIFLRIAAQAAVKQHGWEDAADWASQLREQRSTDKAGYQIGLRAARIAVQQGASDVELAAITDQAVARFPDEVWAARAPVQLMLDRRRFADAAAGAEGLRTRFASAPDGYELGVLALFQLRRIDEATALLAEAKERLGESKELVRLDERLGKWRAYAQADAKLQAAAEAPDAKPHAALKHAQHSDKIIRDFFGQPEAAVARLQAAAQRFPADPAIVAALVRGLTDLGRIDEATETLSASGLVDSQPSAALAWAELAEATGDLDAAATRYQAARALFPDERATHVGLVRALDKLVEKRGADHREAAEAAAREAVARFPDSEELHDLQAWIAQHAGDHRAALERWTAALERFPDSARGRFSFRTRVLDASLALGEAATPVAEATTVGPAAGLSGTDLANRFQNLGSTVFGCEYGGVQRHFGVEPLHLMRWGSCPVASLIDLIDNDFDGFMDEADARLDVSVRPGAGDEYMLRSLRYTLRLDTFVPVNDAPLEQNLASIRRRYVFLTRKLKEELARPDPADKTLFVYKAYEEHVTDQDLDRLAQALQRTGPNTLLAMRRATPEHPAGTARWAGPHHLIGYLPEFGKTAVGVGLPVQHGAWETVMRAAYDLWAQRQAGAAVAA